MDNKEAAFTKAKDELQACEMRIVSLKTRIEEEQKKQAVIDKSCLELGIDPENLDAEIEQAQKALDDAMTLFLDSIKVLEEALDILE